MGQLSPLPKFKFTDSDGVALVGGSLYTYEAGTTTPLATYTDESEGSENTNPIVLDSNGECIVWLGEDAYKFVLKDASGNVLWTVDDIQSINDSSITTAKLGDDAVTSDKLGDAAVITVKIQDLAITTEKLAAKSVTTGKIGDEAVTSTQIADGAVGTAELADGGITPAKLSSTFTNGMNIGRNRIINGLFQAFQRSAIAWFSTPITTGSYIIDRWYYEKVGTMAHTGSAITTDSPTVANALRLFINSFQLVVSTAQSSIASTDYVAIGQKLEGYVFRPLAQRASVVSFWVKSPKTGIHCVALRSSGLDKSCVMEYTVTSANAWQKVTLAFPASPSSGTFGNTTAIGCYLNFTLAAGSNFQTTAGSWQSGNYLATSNQVNCAGTLSDAFLITAVQLESGTIATDYDERHFAQEEQLTMRYYQIASGQFLSLSTGVVTVGAIGGALAFFVRMRTTPSTATVTFSSLVKCNNPIATAVGPNFVLGSADFTASAGVASLSMQITCDAEL